ncbi:VanW family protein [Actinomadura decatromicini]|uniref:VanW family protein n=1 Tax=Actinomadura decatromicini TaxID=2604572 RepID=UPI001652EA6C|nr:VanW family protein [Actinomadura decatromicini]
MTGTRPDRRRRRQGRRDRGREPGLRECARRWWPFVAGTMAATGLLLGAYFWFPPVPAPSPLSAGGEPVGPLPDGMEGTDGTDGAERPGGPMSSYTTRFTPGEPRVRNIELAARILDGQVVQPGATFSFNDAVGPRTRSRGYVPAPAIVGPRLVADVGGGICQVSTTLFNAVFRAGLDIRRARAHSMYMSEYPEGLEAAVSYPDLDFTWRNDTRLPVRVQVAHTGSSLTVSLWGERRYEVRSAVSQPYAFASQGTGVLRGRGRSCVPAPGRPGFEIDVWRTLLLDGREVGRERFHTEYRPQAKVECR